MNISKMSNRVGLLSFSKFIVQVFLIILAFSITINAQEKHSNAEQWKSVGGKIVASGTHDFTNFWYLGGDGMWWKNDENRNNPATHTRDEVTKDVVIKKGQFTVRGPGFLAKFQRRVKGIAVGAGLKFAETGKDFWTASLGGQDYLWGSDGNRKWFDYDIMDFDPAANNGGWVPAGKELTLDVLVYNNESGIGYTQYGAPVGVEYEFWFFPRDGGEVIQSSKILKKDKVALGYIMSIMGLKGGTIERLKSVKDLSGEKLKEGDIIYENDILITHDAMVKIILNHYPDKPLVMMKSNTKIRLEKKAKQKKGGIFNFFGKLFFKGNGKDHRGYKIVTSNAVTGCEATEFETAYDPSTGKTTVSVFEGVVSLTCKNSTAPPIMVNAGMQATMDNNCNQTASILSSDNNTSAKAGWDLDIQPDVKGTGRLAPIADSHVYAYSYRNWNTANWGKYENLGAGWNPTGGEKRAFLKFDLAGIDPNSVNQATLRLYHNHTGGGNAVELGVYRVMSPWQEGSGTYHSGQTEKSASYGEISWVSQPEIDRYPVIYFNPGQDVNKWIEVDVTSLIKAWLTGIPNHGMAIKGGENYIGKSESQYGFRSRECEDSSKRPHLVLSGSGIQHVPQGKLDDAVIIDKNNNRPWVIGTDNGIHYGTKSGWAQQPGGGLGKDIAIDGSGRPWVIGSDNGIHYHDGNRWVQYPGGGKGFAVDVSSDGTPCVIGTDQGIYYHDGNRWVQYPGGGKGFDIDVSSDGTPWVIGTDNGIYYHDGNRWVPYPGGGRGSRIAISPNGTPWVIGSDNRIHYGTGSGWVQQPGEMLAKDITIDESGRPWVISRDNSIYYYDRGRWIEYPGSGRGLAIAISTNKKLETFDLLLMNGSFEKPSVAGSTHKNFGVGQYLAGWKVVKGAVDVVGSYFKSSDGNQNIDLHGSPGFGAIEQTFRTEPQETYKVTFDLAGNPEGEPWIKKIRVSAAEESEDYDFDCTGRTIQQMGWTTKTWYFTAINTSTTLTFATLHNTGGGGLYGPVIDNVRIYRTGK